MFDADQHPYEDPFQPLPKGQYECTVEAVEVKATKAGDDRYNFTLAIEGPAHAGRKLWVAFIPYHAANPDFAAKECGRLSEFSRAAGIIRWRSPQELCGRRVTARVRISREDEDRNEVTGFVVPKLAQGVPVSNPPRDAMRTEGRSAALQKTLDTAKRTQHGPPAPAPHPADFDDSDIPF